MNLREKHHREEHDACPICRKQTDVYGKAIRLAVLEEARRACPTCKQGYAWHHGKPWCRSHAALRDRIEKGETLFERVAKWRCR